MLAGCGSKPKGVAPHWQPAPNGVGAFQLRYNPSASLIDRSELSVEIPAGKGWERIALMGLEDETEIIETLLNRMQKSPKKVYWVVGELTQVLTRWTGQHHCRTMVVMNIEPNEVQAYRAEEESPSPDESNPPAQD